jgi:TolB protein
LQRPAREQGRNATLGHPKGRTAAAFSYARQIIDARRLKQSLATRVHDSRCLMNASLRHILISLAVVTMTAALVCGQRSAMSQAYQLTHSIQYDPSPSPDGKRLVYSIVLEGREQFFVMNVDGTGSVQITRDDADHEDPAWSPDGKKIAFTYIKDKLESISLINPDGTGLEHITPANVRTIHPNWSPDSTRIAYCTDDDLAPPRKNDSDISVIDLATRRITTLITGGINTYPNFSPDGKRLVFRRMVGETNSEVFMANADGTDAHNITNHPAFDGWPAWSPDGTKLAFASNRNSSYQIFTMNPDGTDVRLLAGTDGRGTAPKWSTDGQHIYFSVCKNNDFGIDCQILTARTSGFIK